MTWLWWAPLVAATLHIIEEFVWPGGFADWDRAYRPDFKASITGRLHVIVNAALLFACFSVGLAGMPGGGLELGGMRYRAAIPESLAVPAWLAMAALLGSNAIWHIAGTRQTKRISPGVRTSVALYLLLALFGYWHFLSAGLVSVPMAIGAAVVGGSYHVWAAIAHRARAGGAAGGVG